MLSCHRILVYTFLRYLLECCSILNQIEAYHFFPPRCPTLFIFLLFLKSYNFFYPPQEFNAGLFDYLIANDDSQSTTTGKNDKENHGAGKKSKKHPKRKLDGEFGVVRGIDFKNVHTVSLFFVKL